MILTRAAKIGGTDVLKNIDNLEDGAWKQRRGQAGRRGVGRDRRQVHRQGFEGLKHTDVQLQQNQYKVALYPVGVLAGERAEEGHPGRLRVRS